MTFWLYPICVPTKYDDYGYSGGDTKRPALQQLLKDCEAGLVDIVVVYKIDRLSRSIFDFSELVKFFDDHGIQFVAVTQGYFDYDHITTAVDAIGELRGYKGVYVTVNPVNPRQEMESVKN